MQRHDRSCGVRLSGADRKRLAAALETAREARVYRRVEALLLVAQGQTVAEAARRCHVDRSSVQRWLGQYSAGRDATALADRPRSGRPRQSSRLTPRRLAAVLARDPRHCGYQATSWTVCTAPGCLDNRLRYAARLKVSSCQAARIWAGLRYPFFSTSHSAL